MHMSDGLLSPAVGGTLWAVSAGSISWCSRQVKAEMDDRRIPLMGVLGAFIFAAQMINFTIPGTGSSGHIGGGMILAALLGPHSAFLTIASVLIVQALFFADGGLLALGCNIFNLGFIPCFIAYPLIFRPLAGARQTRGRILVASLLATVVSLQLGAFGVVLQTVLSGISALPFTTFALLMQPIHLAVGIIEGLITAAVVLFIQSARPEVLDARKPLGNASLQKVLIGLAVAALITGGCLSWFASTHPDGLEWAIAGTAGTEELEAPEAGIHSLLAKIQERIAYFPDYGFRPAETVPPDAAETQPAWPAVDPETTLAGLVGGLLTLAATAIIALLLRRRTRRVTTV
jgi:cobalt/nickel transport system permease protein